jgi:hypothetical protein
MSQTALLDEYYAALIENPKAAYDLFLKYYLKNHTEENRNEI